MGHYPYPWWTRLPILRRIYFAGFQRGQEHGIHRGWFQATGTAHPDLRD